MISWSSQKELKRLDAYSPPLSILSLLIFLLSWFSTSFLYLMKASLALSLFLKRYTLVYLEYSSMKVMQNHLPPLVIVFFRSPKSLCIKLSRSYSLSTDLQDFFVVLDSTQDSNFLWFSKDSLGIKLNSTISSYMKSPHALVYYAKYHKNRLCKQKKKMHYYW